MQPPLQSEEAPLQSKNEELNRPMQAVQLDLDERRSSAPPNLLASWIKGVSSSIGRGTSAARFYGSHTSPAKPSSTARAPSAKELKRSVPLPTCVRVFRAGAGSAVLAVARNALAA